MAIRITNFGGTDWEDGQVLWADDLVDTIKVANLIAAPIGTVNSWLKSFTNTPTLPFGWVECNGQTLSDADSVYDGQTIPDLNGDNRFLRGNATSGDTGGSEEHNHQWTQDNSTSTSRTWEADGSTVKNLNTRAFGATGGPIIGLNLDQNNSYTKDTDTKPPYYGVVWIMRVK